MTFQTQKHFMGRDQTILAAEIQSERLISMVRLVIAVSYGAFAIFGLLLGSTAFKVFALQASALSLVFLYSGFFLFNPGKRIFHGYFVYVLVFLDIVVISVIIWSYYLNGAVLE